MVRPGNWEVELDDGTDADRHTEIDGAVTLMVGERLMGSLFGRRWRIDRVDADTRLAHAVPDE